MAELVGNMHKGSSGLLSACGKRNAYACIFLGLLKERKCDTEALLQKIQLIEAEITTYCFLFSIYISYCISYSFFS